MNIECVILAAGLSSRIGRNKMLLNLNEKTVIEYCIAAFYNTSSRIIVVTGHYNEEIKYALSGYDKIHIVYNKDYRDGMFSSVKAGIKAVQSDRFFLTPGDYPLLQSDTINNLIQNDDEIVIPVYKGTRGHPILIKKSLIPFILSSKSESLRNCIAEISLKELEVQDVGIIKDIDTLSDYEKIKAFLQG